MALLRGKKKKWFLKHLKAKYFHYLQIIIILKNQKNKNNQAITINIFHPNYLTQIHQIMVQATMAQVTQTINYPYQKKSGTGIKISKLKQMLQGFPILQSNPHRLIFQIKQMERGVKKFVVLSNLSIYYTWKNVKKSYKTILKY